MRESQCIICGKTFTAKSARKILCSPECTKIRKQELNSRYVAPVKIKIPSNNLVSDVQRAKELGLSYGEYIAKKNLGIVS